jgi:hypothetical protein
VAGLLAAGGVWLVLFMWARGKADEIEAAGNKWRFFGNALLGKLANQGGLDDPLVETGDALSDAYARAVLARLDELAAQKEAITPAKLPESKLLELEAPFGKDSRYWELRYCCTMTSEPNETGPQREQRQLDGTQLLEKIVGRGDTTANTLLLLHFARLRRPVNTVVLRDEMNLLGVAVEMAPDQAWPHYARMLYELEQRQNAAALADLKAGNAAAKLDYPLPYPLSAASTAWTNGGRFGNLEVSGAISLLERGNVRYYAGQKGPSGSRNIIANYLAVGAHSMGELNEWLRFAGRLAESEHTTFLVAGMPLIVLTEVHEAGLRQPGLTAAQTDNLKRLLGAKDAAWQAMREFSHSHDQMDAAMQGVARYGIKGIWFNMGKDPENFVKFYDARIAPIIADIEQVDLTKDAAAPSLAKYAAVTTAELKQRNAERRAAEQGK